MSGALLHVPYAQTDAGIICIGSEPDHEEKLITNMEISTDNEAEERIAALERRIRDMDALVRGLTAELLDLKTVAMAMSRQEGERSRQEIKQGTAVAVPSASASVAAPAGESTVILQKGILRQDVPDALAEPKMARIMQADGTMKMEVRYGDRKTVDSSSGDGRTRKGASARSRQNPLVYADEEGKPGPA
jgi:hypothetical protein